MSVWWVLVRKFLMVVAWCTRVLSFRSAQFSHFQSRVWNLLITSQSQRRCRGKLALQYVDSSVNKPATDILLQKTTTFLCLFGEQHLEAFGQIQNWFLHPDSWFLKGNAQNTRERHGAPTNISEHSHCLSFIYFFLSISTWFGLNVDKMSMPVHDKTMNEHISGVSASATENPQSVCLVLFSTSWKLVTVDCAKVKNSLWGSFNITSTGINALLVVLWWGMKCVTELAGQLMVHNKSKTDANLWPWSYLLTWSNIQKSAGLGQGNKLGDPTIVCWFHQGNGTLRLCGVQVHHHAARPSSGSSTGTLQARLMSSDLLPQKPHHIQTHFCTDSLTANWGWTTAWRHQKSWRNAPALTLITMVSWWGLGGRCLTLIQVAEACFVLG